MRKISLKGMVTNQRFLRTKNQVAIMLLLASSTFAQITVKGTSASTAAGAAWGKLQTLLPWIVVGTQIVCGVFIIHHLIKAWMDENAKVEWQKLIKYVLIIFAAPYIGDLIEGLTGLKANLT